ncbi:hypothetical protein QAD02_010034 [Eretmocerus hayati]|uniref:Uncharacterized protein n=1 Tax=Eretmocerus hayati TaxID=131215 RepID=A0ACC2NBT6_9HYME|nr:hypothetical protein QAD02_010034 [Eretmocerus hayati]
MTTQNELKSLSKRRQSPIDVRDDEAHPIEMVPLTIVGHWLNDGEAIMSNNGEYAILNLKGDRVPSLLRGGPLSGEYEFLNAHFHWGVDDSCGSEHLLNGAPFSMEAHIVHWNRKYHSFQECLKQEDGICVLAFFFLAQDDDDCSKCAMLDKITEHLKDVVEYKSETIIPANSLCWIREATRSDYYYFYQGSLTAGGLEECVTWIIFPVVLPITHAQIAEFRHLKSEKGREVMENRRNVQRIYDRKIYKALIQQLT